MIIEIIPSAITGSITAPASKSVTQRLFALALLHPGKTVVKGHGRSKDELAALEIIKQLNATIQELPDQSLEIKGSSWFNEKRAAPPTVSIHCGESGLSMRMFTSIASILNTSVLISGSGSLLSRPMHFFESVLQDLGVQINTDNGRAPIRLKGPLKPDSISFDGSLSSQFLTGILIALAYVAKQRLVVTVRNLKSRPYITLTMQMMQDFGYKVSTSDYESFQILPANPSRQTIHYPIEGDWSGAAFLLVAAVLHGNVSVDGLDRFSMQADKAILVALEDAGAGIDYQPEKINIEETALTAFEFDATDCPDLFPPLVVLALGCQGISVIKGVHRLLHKESNRAEALQKEFQKMGAVIVINDDAMFIEGMQKLKGAEVDAHDDHRIAMALAIAALGAEGNTRIAGSESVTKSYPGFFEDLEQLGVALRIIN